MKKILIFVFMAISNITFGQKELSKYLISTRVGLSMPIEGKYLKDNWKIGPYVNVNFTKQLRLLDVVLGINYEHLSMTFDNLKFFTPTLGIAHAFLIQRITIYPSLDIGYTWINYTLGKGIGNLTTFHYNEEGLSTSFNIQLSYKMTSKFRLAIGDSYLNIFKSFGPVVNKPDNNNMIGLNRPYVSAIVYL